MMGRSYVIDHCVAAANYEEKQRLYRMYDSECYRMVTECMATVVAILSRGEIQPAYMAVPAYEIFDMKPKKEEKKLTAEQVIADIMADLGEKENQAECSA